MVVTSTDEKRESNLGEPGWGWGTCCFFTGIVRDQITRTVMITQIADGSEGMSNVDIRTRMA